MRMKLLVVASTLDLRHRLGCTPAWWQLLKALHETGHEVIAVPYLGDPVESLWWRTYENPCGRESIWFNSYLNHKRRAGVSPSNRTPLAPVADWVIRSYIRPKWLRHLRAILNKEKDVDALLLMSVPISHMTGIPSAIRKEYGIPVGYYDGDLPTSLPQYAVSRGFRFDYYDGVDLSEFDVFFSNSKQVVADIKAMGGRRVEPLYYAADPTLFTPVDVEKDVDIAYFGYGSQFREEWMEKMITIPSRRLPQFAFHVGGGRFGVDLGNAKLVGDLSYSQFRDFVCRSIVNLNITRWSHTRVYASSTSRPFELAALEACVVSQPYNGIEEWFDIGREILVVNSANEAVETYRWLVDDRQEAVEFGKRARRHILKEHTFQSRALQLIGAIKNLQA